MLAYSSVAQIGYITLGIALANQTGLTGGSRAPVQPRRHEGRAVPCRRRALSTHGLGHVAATSAGIGRRMPLTMAAFVIAGLSLIGVPGTAGFISKWYLGDRRGRAGLVARWSS